MHQGVRRGGGRRGPPRWQGRRCQRADGGEVEVAREIRGELVVGGGSKIVESVQAA
jgi:hypothetical protein